MLEFMETDVVIVGGGIVGAAIARQLSQYRLQVILVEKHPDLAMGTTKANSAIVHAGFDAEVGTLKAKLNVRGNALYQELQAQLGLDIKRVGTLVVAKDEEGLVYLQQLLERGRQNGVPDLAIWGREQLLQHEPNLTPEARGALYAPTGGIMDPMNVTLAFAENAARNGVRIITECTVEKIEVRDGKAIGLQTSRGFITASYVINAAGIHADDLSSSAGDNSFTITPRKGEYILFDRSVGTLVNMVVFPIPSKISKGIVVLPSIHGNTFVGPNAVDVADKDDVATTAAGLNEIMAGAQLLMPNLPFSAAITQFAGLRAVAGSNDFVIRPSEFVRGLIHAAGIQSPGLTAAPAIAEMVVDILRDEGLELIEKTDFSPNNPPKLIQAALSDDEMQSLIAENPSYGQITCRCEAVSEGSIVHAIHNPCGATTVDGVKRRTRAGMGRCQGGFCGPRVISILSRELNVPITAVRKDTAQSYLFYEKIRGENEGGNHV